MPGLVVALPLGPIVLRGRRDSCSGSFQHGNYNRDRVVDLELTPGKDTYEIWQNTVLPLGNEQVVLIANSTGADRSVRQSVSLYPTGKQRPCRPYWGVSNGLELRAVLLRQNHIA